MEHSLNFAQTNQLKGLLILLVIFGHLRIVSLDYITLLYSFHVSSFLFLPFLFNQDRLSKEHVVKIFRRYYIPYTIFFITSLILYTLLMGNHIHISAVLQDFFIGTSSHLKESIGLSLYWFFPTLIVLLLLLMVYNTLQKDAKKKMFFIMIVIHLLLPFFSKAVWQESYFYAFGALYLFSIGIMIRYIYKHFAWKDISLAIYLALFLGLLYTVYGGVTYNLAKSLMPNLLENPIYFMLHDIILIVGFFTMAKLSLYLPFLENIGRLSIAMYTIHPFFIQFYYKVVEHYHLYNYALVKFLFVVMITYMSVLIIKNTALYRYIYPR